jgi:hypothetical protein
VSSSYPKKYNIIPTLHWLTKETDFKAAANTPYRLLVEAETHSCGDYVDNIQKFQMHRLWFQNKNSHF